jgi:hypothetical protein
MIYAGYWSHEYTDKNIVTDHYDLGDYLTFNYKADLKGYDQRIECRLYNDDTNELLMTTWLNAGVYNVNIPGGSADRCRNIRIECDHRCRIIKIRIFLKTLRESRTAFRK